MTSLLLPTTSSSSTSTQILLDAALQAHNKNRNKRSSSSSSNIINNQKQHQWIQGQSLKIPSSSHHLHHRCHLSSRVSTAQTTLVFDKNDHTKTPFVGYWYRLNDLDCSRQLRDSVESDILVSKKMKQDHHNNCPFLLEHVDSQVVFSASASSSSDDPTIRHQMSSNDAYLLHVVKFCSGDSLFSLVQDRLAKIRASSSSSSTNQIRSSSSSSSLLATLILPLSSVCRITLQLLQAVDALHHNHQNQNSVATTTAFTHNAINLHNIFLDDENKVRLGNFGKSSSLATSIIQNHNNKKPSSLLRERNSNVSNNKNNSSSRSSSMNNNNNHTKSQQPPRVTRSTSSASNNNNIHQRHQCDFCVLPPEDELLPIVVNSHHNNHHHYSSSRNSRSTSPFTTANPWLSSNTNTNTETHHQEKEEMMTTTSVEQRRKARDIFSVGVVCYELLFGSAPPLKPTKGNPETSLAMRLIALREEIMTLRKNHQTQSSSSTHSSVIEEMLVSNELLCRFLLLSLNSMPLERPTSSECVAMFQTVLSTSSTKHS